MKKVFTGVGAIFVRIWSWIKETAWVQPLLIVGLIFGVIFSIPTITTWIQGLANSVTSAETYYKKYRKSLANDENSDAQKLVDSMIAGETTYGEKFILMIVQSGCTGCEEAQPAIKLLDEKTNRFYDEAVQGQFKFYTIFSDQTLTDSEWNDQDGKFATPWDAFLDRNTEFLEKSADVAANSWYSTNGYIEQTAINGLEDGSNMTTPTLFLYDVSTSNTSGSTGISEVMFGVTGDTSYDKAELLTHCWNHTDEFTAPV